MNRVKPEDLINQFESVLDKLDVEVDVYKTGRVSTLYDGICDVVGLDDALYGEVVIFENKQKGLIVELNEYSAKVAILDSEYTVSTNMKVYSTQDILKVKTGNSMTGRVVNALGEPIDDKGEIYSETSDGNSSDNSYSDRIVMADAPPIIAREKVTKPLYTGVKAIDALIPIGYGQRELILGDRRTGKTTIAIGTILNQKQNYQNGKPVHCVYVCIGKKLSEAAKIAQQLKEQGAMDYTTIVVASAEDPCVLQYLAPYVGTAIAEQFRDNGQDALIIYDDLSNHAIAYRELSLLLKRFPGREAYPGDIFFIHSSLLERAACLHKDQGGGSLTAIPIVETLEGDISSYIATNVISITDGQIFLDNKLFLSGQKPAINTTISVSRVGGNAQTKAMRKVSGMLKLELSQYSELKDFSKVTEVDEPTKKILKRGEIVTYTLRQGANKLYSFEDQILTMFACNVGCFDKFPLEQLQEVAERFVSEFKQKHPSVVQDIINTEMISDENNHKIKEFIINFQGIDHQ